MTIGAYVHIPFCQHICYYCNFNKVFLAGQPVDDYITCLLKEMRLVTAAYPEKKLSTLYIGGGTPSALTVKQLDRLLNGMRDILPFSGGEFTFEANPNDLLATDKLKVLFANGVNRLSIGVQSFNDDILKRIGRTHRSADVYQAIANARKVGFENISIDLIFKLPKQSREDFAASLDQALALDLPHYSTYSLILERQTVFYNLMRRGKLPLPSQDVEADMYDLALNKFSAAGRRQYEISNFARPGYESQHNLIYWRNQQYFGFGAGASGYLGKTRYQNLGPIQQYLDPLHADQVPIFQRHVLPRSEQIEEQLFLGLRMKAGVDKQQSADRFGFSMNSLYGNVIRQLISRGLLAEDQHHIWLTRQGEFLGNDVFQAFLLDSET